jgi:hypothetical protein
MQISDDMPAAAEQQEPLSWWPGFWVHLAILGCLMVFGLVVALGHKDATIRELLEQQATQQETIQMQKLQLDVIRRSLLAPSREEFLPPELKRELET